MDVDQYPLPKPVDLFAALAGGDKFTKMDLASAYQQVELDQASQELVTLNTHQGPYRPVRMPFGIANAPAVFQNIMDQILHGLKGVVCYLDDILVTGKNDEEHLANLKAVFEKLKHHGIRLKRSKCSFMADAVDYLGYRIDVTGLLKTGSHSESATPIGCEKLAILFRTRELLRLLHPSVGYVGTATE
eukprot:m.302821 g.302821  ORF g.302821 m.302821 type:complete len:188 (+) comp40828_c0_seq6:152-715(+)